MEIFYLEIRLKGILPVNVNVTFLEVFPLQPILASFAQPIMPVKPLDALERIIKSHSLTMPCKKATPLYKWHPFVYNKDLFDS